MALVDDFEVAPKRTKAPHILYVQKFREFHDTGWRLQRAPKNDQSSPNFLHAQVQPMASKRSKLPIFCMPSARGFMALGDDFAMASRRTKAPPPPPHSVCPVPRVAVSRDWFKKRTEIPKSSARTFRTLGVSWRWLTTLRQWHQNPIFPECPRPVPGFHLNNALQLYWPWPMTLQWMSKGPNLPALLSFCRRIHVDIGDQEALGFFCFNDADGFTNKHWTIYRTMSAYIATSVNVQLQAYNFPLS
ncbi:uncharacterized protein LAJ45_07804 [Morchella importuna]|uniref:uncharacterized protein n=1 Tax=Morchella importuna TaxID=1174673 RepID=UPI001E8D4BDA|nr:uncharacterized protein LAJ45_07804 [Morchella importuna]KAH8148040.1 hypothetical protein LAJ45_07804 [Morchella importuna]